MQGLKDVTEGAALRKRVGQTWAGLMLAAAALLLGGRVSAAGSGNHVRIVATVGDHQITDQELEEKIKPQLAALQNQLYELRKRAIDSIADEYLVRQAAGREGLSESDYLKREIESKVSVPTDDEIRKFYEQHKSQIGQPLDHVKSALSNFMQQRALRERRQELIARLRKNAPVRVMLEPPRYEVSADGRPALGPKSAPVTIVEFGDFQCPYCRKVEDTLKAVRSKYGDKLRLVYRDFPLQMHPEAEKAAEAGQCAAAQNKFWEFHDAMFADQSKLKVDDLKAAAARLGADSAKFNACLDRGEYAEQIRKDVAEGNTLGVEGTPAFFINGRFLNGAQPPGTFENIIDEELARTQARGAARPAAARAF